MQASAEGLSLADIRAALGCGRRTAERLRDALIRSFPHAEEVSDGGRIKRWRLPAGTLTRLVSFTAEELVELGLTADALRLAGLAPRAAVVEGLALKLRALLPPRLLARLEPDVEALLAAERHVPAPGLVPAVRADVLAGLREALKGGRAVEILHRPVGTRTGTARWHTVRPHGLLYGKRHYFVATAIGGTGPHLWHLPDLLAVCDAGPLAPSPAPVDLATVARRRATRRR